VLARRAPRQAERALRVLKQLLGNAKERGRSGSGNSIRLAGCDSRAEALRL
jgi:hypothetical protein